MTRITALAAVQAIAALFASAGHAEETPTRIVVDDTGQTVVNGMRKNERLPLQSWGENLADEHYETASGSLGLGSRF